MVTVLKQNQNLRIKGKEYRVSGMIAYAQENWKWKEYTLRDTSGRLSWLYVETDQGETEYTLYTKCRFSGTMNDISINYNGRVYNRYESGVAVVKSYFGPEDVDVNERVRFSDYRNEETETYLSIEDWEGEKEYTYGEELDEKDIVILSDGNAYANTAFRGSMEPKKKRVSSGWILVGIVVICCMIGGIFRTVTATPIRDYLESDSNYQYVTSVTNNNNNKKARVYASDLTVDGVVDDIIGAIPGSIKSVLQASDEDDTTDTTTDTSVSSLDTSNGVGILSRNEYAYVYTSEGGQTYIQVSGNEFMNGQSNAYRSSTRSGYYYNTYRRKRSHVLYTSTLRSARQSSTSSRIFSGGGTSSGK